MVAAIFGMLALRIQWRYLEKGLVFVAEDKGELCQSGKIEQASEQLCLLCLMGFGERICVVDLSQNPTLQSPFLLV